ncbi:MAG: DUF177 domain-containing protein [Bacteroidetes bacterium]|nr:MAG: DUF177 domain-containing protein [Bacteroidota bacterium]
MKREQHELKIRITQLSEGTHNYHFAVKASELELAENFQDLIEITAVLEKTHRQLYFKIQISAKAEFQCDRCADRFYFAIQAPFTVCYGYDESASGNSADDELRLIHPGTPYIDVTEDVRQVILLAIPLKLICNEECKGLCPHCGINLNRETCTCADEPADSRWDELRKLIEEKNN